MTPKLRALLAVVGFVAAGGTIGVLLEPRATTAPVEMADAGLTEGTLVPLRCRVRLAAEALADIQDAGDDGFLTGRYGTILTRGRRFDLPDGGFVIVKPDPTTKLEHYGPDACEVLEDAGVPLRTRAVRQACACRRASGICRVPNPDGGTDIAAPFAETLQPGWSGLGCQPKPCVEIAGESSWPDNCPDRDAG